MHTQPNIFTVSTQNFIFALETPIGSSQPWYAQCAFKRACFLCILFLFFVSTASCSNKLNKINFNRVSFSKLLNSFVGCVESEIVAVHLRRLCSNFVSIQYMINMSERLVSHGLRLRVRIHMLQLNSLYDSHETIREIKHSHTSRSAIGNGACECRMRDTRKN